MTQPTSALGIHRLCNSLRRFREDEDGTMAFFFLLMFILMITFGGIAIDVMRFETRRVAMQQTLDRAALAAASLTQARTPKQVVDDYFAKADLSSGLEMVKYSTPVVAAVADAGLRRVTVSADVTSYNFFMTIFSKNDYLKGPAITEAAQGVSQIEVMMVLDITGSMTGSAGNGKTKIKALQDAASEFVTILKANDKKDGISIGIVPYAAQVNVPENLRAEFNETNVSSWNGLANQGVYVTGGTQSDINCLEFPTSSFTSTGFPVTTPIAMAAVADSNSDSTTTTNYEAPLGPVATSRACTTNAEVDTTAWRDADVNKVLLPTKDADKLKEKISRLTAQGNTYIAVGMRWGTALIDQEARPIYTNLLSGEAGMAGRPADNASLQTRKIIILMTDGDHVTNNHIVDAFKTGISPIWRGTDGNFAIRYTSGGPALTGGARPATCSLFPIATTRQYFVPHLKDNAESPRVNVTDIEGYATSAAVAAACDPNAWFAAPSWPQTVADGPDADDERDLVTVPDGPDADNLPDVVMVTATQLDWSEVWRYLRVSWVARQLYMRSGVAGTNSYSTVMNQFRTTYLSSTTNMDSLLQSNCAIARKDPKAPVDVAPLGKGSGIEVYGIAFGSTVSAIGQAQINGCSSEPKENYYFYATDGDKLLAAFKAIATDISELRLTQ
jgi:Flp pilus assembly protein TadG